jgi:ribosome-associated toxin RatA of RatAB toxin-antitoxin module
MHRIQKSAIMPYTIEQMFQLVNDIEKYPEFLPWCQTATVLARDDKQIKATLVLAKGGLEKSFTTINSLDTPKQMIMELVDGPFKHLKGIWDFCAIGEKECQVELDLEFQFSSKMIALVFGPFFQQAASKLVDSFVKRADDVYGG